MQVVHARFPLPFPLHISFYSAEEVWLTNCTLKLTQAFPSLFLLLPHINMNVIVRCDSHLPVTRQTFPKMRDSLWTLSILYIPISQFLIPWGKWAPYLCHCSVLSNCLPNFLLKPRTCDCDAFLTWQNGLFAGVIWRLSWITGTNPMWSPGVF